ncbi:DUF397 domain-containing protein [Streptomyces sp. NPDC048825]|uniref:DUF397 domain-containing protein n=1 Tax=Streptomyces sp. NPDC048825 TaxID=3365592 RepID=UPI0037234F68
MPPRTAPPLLRQGNDESKATPALLISLRLPVSARGIDVRDSKAVPSPSLASSPASWSTFLRALTADTLIHGGQGVDRS